MSISDGDEMANWHNTDCVEMDNWQSWRIYPYLKYYTCPQGLNCGLVLFKVKHCMTRCLGFIYTCWLGWNCNM